MVQCYLGCTCQQILLTIRHISFKASCTHKRTSQSVLVGQERGDQRTENAEKKICRRLIDILLFVWQSKKNGRKNIRVINILFLIFTFVLYQTRKKYQYIFHFPSTFFFFFFITFLSNQTLSFDGAFKSHSKTPNSRADSGFSLCGVTKNLLLLSRP